MSFDKAVRVDSVEAEYQYVRSQRCACGGTYLQVGAKYTQSLLFDSRRRPYDRIRVPCDACQAPADFWFDVASFFGRPFWEQDHPHRDNAGHDGEPRKPGRMLDRDQGQVS